MLKTAGLKRAVLGLALLGLLTAMGAASAQRKHLPSRTEPIPDTEPEAERARAKREADRAKAKEKEAAPSLMIYGPPTAPLGAPPSPPIPESVVKPAESPAPAAPVATPAPVVTPTAPPPAPVAVPIPAPAPAAPVAKPEPPAPPPAPVAKPEPPAPPPAPIAKPEPAVPPPTEAAPERVPAPPPVAAPAPAPTPPPRIAAPAAPVPAPTVATPAPATAPPPVAKPAPAVAPATARREVAAIAPTSSPFAAPKLDARTVEQIFSCLAPGLPQDWKKSWVILTGSEGSPTARFLVTTTYRDEDAEEFVPCDAREITRRIAGLSASLPPEQRRWRSAQLAIDSEGQYTLKYDYAR